MVTCFHPSKIQHLKSYPVSSGWNGHGTGTQVPEGQRQGFRLIGISVYQKYALERIVQSSNPVEQFVAVGMRAKALDDGHLGTPDKWFSKYTCLVGTVHQLFAKGALCLKADDEYRFGRVFYGVLKMVQHLSGFAHAGSRDDDARYTQVVKFFGLLHIPRISTPSKPERITGFHQKTAGFFVETFRMEPENVGHIGRERAVYKNGQSGILPLSVSR